MQKVQRYRSDLRRIEGEIPKDGTSTPDMMVFKVQIKTDMAVDDLENKLFGRLECQPFMSQDLRVFDGFHDRRRPLTNHSSNSSTGNPSGGSSP